MKRAFSLVELVVFISVAGLLSSVALPRIRPTVELIHYRSVMQQVASQLRVMRFRAMNEQRTFCLRIDHPSRRLQWVAQDVGPAPSEWVERTIWLPEGLTVLDAPSQLSVSPAGAMTHTSLLMAAPKFSRIFRITLDANGLVRLNEEPST